MNKKTKTLIIDTAQKINSISILRISLLFLIVLFPSIIYSETIWISRLFRPSDGLAYQVVRDIAQSPDGSIWFATWGGGLSKFNGSLWETTNPEKDLSDYMIRTVVYDRQGGLWVGTQQGIKYYDGRHWQLFSKKTVPELLSDSVFCILPKKNGEIWFGMNEGYLYSYDPKQLESQRWKLVYPAEFFQNRSIRCLMENNDGSLWIGGGQIYRIDGDKSTSYDVDQRIYSILETKDGRVFAAGTQFLHQKRGESWEIIEEAPKEPRCIVETQDGSILVGTTLGVHICEQGTWKNFELSKDTPYPYVEAIRSFQDGSIWVGTRNGAYLVRPSDWSTVALPSSQFEFSGNRFFTSPQTSPWLVSAKGDIYHWMNEKWVLQKQSQNDPYDTLEILSQNNNRISIHKEDAILEYNTQDFSLIQSIPIPSSYYFGKANQTSNGIYWIHGYEGEGLFYWDKSTWRSYEGIRQRLNKRVQLLDETQDGTQWIFFSDGIEAINKDVSRIDFYQSPGFQGHRITDICTTRNGWVWFGSSSVGIFVFDGEKTQKFTTHNGLPNDWILCLYESSNGTLWVGMDDSTIASYRDNRWITYTKKEIQLDGRITKISEDPSGTMWFAVDPTGLVRYRPSSNAPDTAIDVFPKDIIPQGMGIFSFHGWDAWHTTLPKELVFSWRILSQRTGLDIVPWTPYKLNTTINSPPLDPGNYIFEVRSADKERNIDPTPAIVQFSVEPYFFMKPGFLIPIILFMLTAFVSLLTVYNEHLKLRESEKWLSLAQKIAHIGHWVADFSRNKLVGSDETFRILGIHPSDFSGTYKSFLRLVHPKDLNLVQKTVRAALKNQQSFTVDHHIIQPDGSIRSVQIQAEIAVNDSGAPLSLIGTIKDITDRRRLEEVVQRVQKLEAIGVLASGIAHDFNNLLTVIMGNISLVKRTFTTQDKNHQRLTESENATLKAHHLTKKLISFGEANNPSKKVCSLKEFIKHPALLALSGSNVHCDFKIADDLKPVEIDRGQIDQVIRNLITNAWQSMPEGGVIRLLIKNTALEDKQIATLPKGDYVQITIEDRGCGIPPENLSRIFDPYFTTKDNYTQKGLGLGLTICYSIIKQHHGQIEVESELGIGSKFHVYLPAYIESPS